MTDTTTLTASQTKEVETLFNLGAHLGHKKNRLHPKAKKHVYKMINGASVIDLSLTVKELEHAKNALTEAAKEGKSILLVATKKVAAQFAAELCKTNSIPSVTTKWLPGLLTNFDTIIKNVNQLRKLQEEKTTGEWEKYVKHERTQIDKKISRLTKFYGGLLLLDKKPDIMIVIDIRKEKNAIDEATSFNIPVVGLVDTNADPMLVKYPIVANDDASVVVEYILTELVNAYVEGKK
ncbi:30S ribosomal protein S2 [Candidatus Roizmanbacteria bacterium]|nr:30S ribosomal protein S2 [Candidatus Roizmanbacteria bacterium]